MVAVAGLAPVCTRIAAIPGPVYRQQLLLIHGSKASSCFQMPLQACPSHCPVLCHRGIEHKSLYPSPAFLCLKLWGLAPSLELYHRLEFSFLSSFLL